MWDRHSVTPVPCAGAAKRGAAHHIAVAVEDMVRLAVLQRDDVRIDAAEVVHHGVEVRVTLKRQTRSAEIATARVRTLGSNPCWMFS